MRSLFFLLLSAGLFASCVRKDFDAPPDTTGNDPMLPVNMKIADLKTRFAGPGTTAIDSDWTIYGVVTADDRSGNLYKQINIEDSTGGITLLLERNSLYTDYPVGRKVYVKLKGLHYGFYGNYPQIGFAPDAQGGLTNIPTAVMSDYVVKANYPNTITPLKFTDLSVVKTNPVENPRLNRLIEVADVEFIDSDTSKTYAEPATVSSGTDRTIRDCFGNTVKVRTSAYASFAAYRVPKGRGTIRAILSRYNNTIQLIIVDTAGVDMYGPRCGSGPTPTLPLVGLDSLRRRFAASGAATLGSMQITGVVISNRLRHNLEDRNLVLQQGDRGIVVRFSAEHSFNQGDSIVVNVSGQSLSEFSGLLQVTNPTGATFSPSNGTRISPGHTVVPQTLTIAQLTGSAFESYESTLVRIAGATASGGSTYTNTNSSGQSINTSRTLNDGTGTVTLYTDGDATFGQTALPTGAKTWTGIVGQFGTAKQFSIRDVTDVQ